MSIQHRLKYATAKVKKSPLQERLNRISPPTKATTRIRMEGSQDINNSADIVVVESAEQLSSTNNNTNTGPINEMVPTKSNKKSKLYRHHHLLLENTRTTVPLRKRHSSVTGFRWHSDGWPVKSSSTSKEVADGLFVYVRREGCSRRFDLKTVDVVCNNRSVVNNKAISIKRHDELQKGTTSLYQRMAYAKAISTRLSADMDRLSVCCS
jgi:hypothetical protein